MLMCNCVIHIDGFHLRFDGINYDEQIYVYVTDSVPKHAGLLT